MSLEIKDKANLSQLVLLRGEECCWCWINHRQQRLWRDKVKSKAEMKSVGAHLPWTMVPLVSNKKATASDKTTDFVFMTFGLRPQGDRQALHRKGLQRNTPPKVATAAKEPAESREVPFHLTQGQNLRFCLFVLKQSSGSNCISLHLSRCIYLASLFPVCPQTTGLVLSLQTRVI